MRLARVVGPLWGARRAQSLTGYKLLELETRDGSRLCAVDALGAGPGEWVIVAHGSRVRDLTVGPQVADKDIIVGIVDGIDLVQGQWPAGFGEAHASAEPSEAQS